MSRKSLGIYIHIPFCVQKCFYCDFVSGPATDRVKRNYVNCILKEIEYRAEQLGSISDYEVDTVFIGGGTPSVLDADWIKEILCKLGNAFFLAGDCECSIEVNPGTVDFEKLKKYREAGINRLSIGLQSCHDNELKALGRIHDYKAFENIYKDARAAGFENINVDLMSSIPEQTEESFADSLQRVIKLKPEHISVYSLIVEENTPFYDMDLKLPDEEEERRIYHETGRILKEYGYEQYEISNYAKPGKECKHNIRYWKCKEYIGFGCAAASYLESIRWKNTEDINQYMSEVIKLSEEAEDIGFDSSFFTRIKSLYCETDYLTLEEKCSEYMFMGLRMNEGISEEEFEKNFDCTIDEKYRKIIEKHIQNGLLVRSDKRVTLTERGRDISNFVMADFLL